MNEFRAEILSPDMTLDLIEERAFCIHGTCKNIPLLSVTGRNRGMLNIE